MSRNKSRSIELEVKLLSTIGKFGWIRTIEIARIIWKPDSEEEDLNAYKYAHKFLSDLQVKGLVHLAKLPERAGTAVFLQNKGIALLKGKYINANKVKNNNQTWVAPPTWMHDLMVQGLFAYLVRYKYTDAECYLTDRDCKSALIDTTSDIFSHNTNLKVPDLITKFYRRMTAFEVERASKTNKNLVPLVDPLIKTNLGSAPNTYNGIKPDIVAIAIDIDQKTTPKTEGGKISSLNHGKSILKKVNEKLIELDTDQVIILQIEMHVYKFGVTGIHIIHEGVLRKNRVDDYFRRYEEHLKEDQYTDYTL